MGLPSVFNTFTFNHADQIDEYGQSIGDFNIIQTNFDSRAEELRVHTNLILTALTSTTVGDSGIRQIGSEPVSGITGATLYDTLVNFKQAIDDATVGTLPDNSITNVKIQDNTIEAEKLADFVNNQFGTIRNFDQTDTNVYRAEIVESFIEGRTFPDITWGATDVAEDDTHFYIGGANGLTKVNKVTGVRELTAPATGAGAIGAVYTVELDETFVYVGTHISGASTRQVRKLNTSDFVQVSQTVNIGAGTGVFNQVRAILFDDTYVYFCINFGSVSNCGRVLKSALNSGTTNFFNYGNEPYTMQQDDTFMYISGEASLIRKFNKSDGSIVASRIFSSSIRTSEISVSDGIFYAGNRSTNQVELYNTSDLSDYTGSGSEHIVFEFPNDPVDMHILGNKLYVHSLTNASNTISLYRFDKTTLEVEASYAPTTSFDNPFSISEVSGVVTLIMSRDDSPIYVGEGHRINNGIVRVVTV